MATAAVDVETPPVPATPTTPAGGVNRPLANGGVSAGGDGDGDGAVGSIVRKWRQEEFRDKCAVALRALTCLFSLIAAVVMATNQHGDWKDSDHYQEYRYLAAVGFLAFAYTLVQLIRFVAARDFVAKRFAGIVDFGGDQITAYLMISSLSAAIPMTNRMREGADNAFTDSSVTSICMAFFAFICISVCAMVSGYKLSRQPYV